MGRSTEDKAIAPVLNSGMIEALDPWSLDMPPLKAWSHSRIVVFELCRNRAKLAYIDKIPEPPRALPPGKTEHANDRGTRIHNAAEAFVKGGVELVHELVHFTEEFHQLRAMKQVGQVSLEGEWAFTREWEATGWMSSTTWSRIKLDAIAFLSKKKAVVIDYKSGKRWGNEMKHHEQMVLYQLAAFIKFPELEEITVELWYTDLDEIHSLTYKRHQGLKFLTNWERRGTEMTACEEFPPNPSKYACRWCPYKPTHLGGTGHCPDGV